MDATILIAIIGSAGAVSTAILPQLLNDKDTKPRKRISMLGLVLITDCTQFYRLCYMGLSETKHTQKGQNVALDGNFDALHSDQ